MQKVTVSIFVCIVGFITLQGLFFRRGSLWTTSPVRQDDTSKDLTLSDVLLEDSKHNALRRLDFIDRTVFFPYLCSLESDKGLQELGPAQHSPVRNIETAYARPYYRNSAHSRDIRCRYSNCSLI